MTRLPLHEPLQPMKRDCESAVAERLTTVPGVNEDSVGVGGVTNSARTDTSDATVTSHSFVPEHAPLHRENTAPGAGVGASRTRVPPNMVTSQLLEQSESSGFDF